MAASTQNDLAKVLDEAGCAQEVGEWIIAKCEGRLATFALWIKGESECIEIENAIPFNAKSMVYSE